MTLFSLLAAAYTFTATATGVEKGASVEFIMAGANSDRDYESMFLLDESVSDFCSSLEKAGIPRGKPTDPESCRMWPVGCTIVFDPPITNYVDVALPDGIVLTDPIYTGGTRKADGKCESDDTMPAAVFSTFSLSQSPITFNGLYDQGTVYGCYTAKIKLEKGCKVRFTVSSSSSLPQEFRILARPGKCADVISKLRELSSHGEISAQVDFDDEMTVGEAKTLAEALAVIDSVKVKINSTSSVFYQAFRPLVKWLDRQERLHQPFELSLNKDGSDVLMFIDEDWTVEGDDPKLTPKPIRFADAATYTKTDTCFIYAAPTEKISRLKTAMSQMKGSSVRTWYVFVRQ